MSTGLSVSSYVVANASISRCSMRRMLGSYELVFLIDVAPTPLREKAWWISPQSVRVKVVGSIDHELGIARPDRSEVVQQSAGAYSRQVWVMLSLQPHQLSAIEECRDAGDLTFALTILGDGGDGEKITDIFQAQERLTIPRSDWIEQLRSAGALDILLLEIPMPFDDPTATAAEAAKRLRQAQSHFIAGNYGDSVGACRLALDELGVGAKPLDLLGPGRSAMTKAERGQAMLAAIRHFTHPAHHIATETYSRADARLVLQMTSAVVAAGPF